MISVLREIVMTDLSQFGRTFGHPEPTDLRIVLSMVILYPLKNNG
jgi:hypothetical protein